MIIYTFSAPNWNRNHDRTRSEYSEIMMLVLKYAKEVGIDLEARDNRGRTPMHHLCDYGYYQEEWEECVKKFLKMAKYKFGIEFNKQKMKMEKHHFSWSLNNWIVSKLYVLCHLQGSR